MEHSWSGAARFLPMCFQLERAEERLYILDIRE